MSSLLDTYRVLRVVAEGLGGVRRTENRRCGELKLDARSDEFERLFAGKRLWLTLHRVLWKEFAVAAPAGLLAAATAPAIPYVMQRVFVGLGAAHRGTAASWAAVASALLLLQLLANWWQDVRNRRLWVLVQALMQRSLFSRLQQLPARELRERGRDPLTYISRYATQITQAIYVIPFIINVLLTVALAVVLGWWFGATSLIVLIVVGLAVVALQRMIVLIGRVYYAYIDADHMRVRTLDIIARALPSLRRQQLEPQALRAIADVRARQLKLLNRRSWLQITNRSLEYGLTPLASLVIVAAAVWAGWVINGVRIFPFLLLTGLLLDALFAALANFRVLRNTLGPTREIERVFSENAIAPAGESRLEAGEVEISIVGVGSRSFPAGSTIAIVGETATGKTTLLESVAQQARTALPLSIQVGGEAIFVARQTPAFDSSVADFVVLWERPVDPDRYANALVRSGLSEEVPLLGGESRILSSKDSQLSEGQLQRLALAQALYAKADVLLLDDSFAPLDPLLADNVAAALTAGPETVIYVTSRLELVSHADAVLVLARDRAVLLDREGQADDLELSGLLAANTLSDLRLALAVTPQRTPPSQEVVPRQPFETTGDERDSVAASTLDTVESAAAVSARTLLANVQALFSRQLIITLLALLVIIGGSEIGFAALIENWGSSTRFDASLFVGLAAIALLAITGTGMRYLLTFRSPLNAIDRLHWWMSSRLLGAELSDADGRHKIAGRIGQDFVDLEMETPNRIVSIGGELVLTAVYAVFVAVTNVAALALMTPIFAAGFLVYRHGRDSVVAGARLRASVRGPVLAHVSPALEGAGYRLSPALRQKIRRRFAALTELQADATYWAMLATNRVSYEVEGLGIAALLAIIWMTVALLGTAVVTAPVLLVFVAFAFAERLTALIKQLQQGGSVATQLERLSDLLGVQRLPTRRELMATANAPDELYAALLESDERHRPADAPPLVAAELRVTGRNGAPILDRISLYVGAGEHVAITGRSGIGKSTLLRAMVGLIPAEGRVALYGLAPRPMSSLDRALSCTLESDTPLLPITAREFLDPLLHRADADLVSAVEETGVAELTSRLDERLDRFSHGERQRLNVARYLVERTPLLILDEATSALDSEAERELLLRLENLVGIDAIVAAIHRRTNVDLFERQLDLEHRSTLTAVEHDVVGGLTDSGH